VSPNYNDSADDLRPAAVAMEMGEMPSLRAEQPIDSGEKSAGDELRS
jgi:hypothetical protein